VNSNECFRTYETSTDTKSYVVREGTQHNDDGSEPHEQSGIALPEFVKRLCLLLEYVKDRLGVFTAIDLGGEGMVPETYPSLFGVLRQGGIQRRLKGEDGIGSRGHEDMPGVERGVTGG